MCYFTCTKQAKYVTCLWTVKYECMEMFFMYRDVTEDRLKSATINIVFIHF